MPLISAKHGSLSVSIAGISSLNFSVPMSCSKLSMNFTTLLEFGLFIIFISKNCNSGKINDKIDLESVLILPRKQESRAAKHKLEDFDV